MATANSIKVLNYLKAHNGEDLTAADVAAEVGVSIPTVNGTFTGLVRKGYGVREEAVIELEDGKTKTVKFLRLTDAGMAYEPELDAPKKTKKED